ncbi:hypothetical protein [Pleurocapsa sp. PCC 7327]|uniref:hypothetical protein n=1 Tax=Pleurocapsa sp. PCC 7327 TaxID=118163 RepID=UPI00090059D9|nr:hypothetical protein [Pleurocapsa sp. PCC 7327]
MTIVWLLSLEYYESVCWDACNSVGIMDVDKIDIVRSQPRMNNTNLQVYLFLHWGARIRT